MKLNLPETADALLTIDSELPLPKSYRQAAAESPWPRRFFWPTEEPTSDALDGVFLHYLAQPGQGATHLDLPDYLVPFAHDGQRYFAFDRHDWAVRYVDVEVDQWLTLAPDFETFWAGLQDHVPLLDADTSDLAFSHYCHVATAADLPALLAYARDTKTVATYQALLLAYAQRRDGHFRSVVQAEYRFLTDYAPHLITKTLTAAVLGEGEQV